MLTDLDNTLIAWLEPVLDAVFGVDTIDVIPAAIVKEPQATGPAVHLMLHELIEHPKLKGTGESYYVDSNNNSVQRPAPAWLQCSYYLAAEVPAAAVGQAPFTTDNLRQAQIKMLEPLARHLLVKDSVDAAALSGCYGGVDPGCEITNVIYKQMYQHPTHDVPVIEFELTASISGDEVSQGLVIQETTMEPGLL